MVLFLNIFIGQKVLVKTNNRLLNGVVRYKGFLNGQPGQWVGVELELPFGSHNGCWRGNQYFKCPDKHGLFTHSCNTGFHSINRKSKNNYKTKSSNSYVEEELFGKVPSNDIKNGCITKEYLEIIESYISGYSKPGSNWHDYPSYNKSHLVGKNIPCAIISKKEPKKIKMNKKKPDYFLSLNSSIPHYRMSHEVQLESLKRGDFNNKSFKQPRFLSV